MSHQLLQFSMFQDVLFPADRGESNQQQQELSLRRAISFVPHGRLDIYSVPLVVFDLETTGLDAQHDHIIEIGAQKILNGKVIGEMSTLVYTRKAIPIEVQQITGIDQSMLVGKPPIGLVMQEFLKFIESCLLVAHNAAFDLGFIKATCERLGIDLEWPVFCTLKLARQLLPELERKNLDSLAAHYDLQFESRHRSIGDVKVTAAVLRELLSHEGAYLKNWQDLEPFKIA